MRITNRLMTDNSVRNMSETLDNLYTLQQKAATGKKYLRPSDNPSVTSDNLTLNSSLRSIETYTNTIQSTKQWMETTDFALQRFGETLSKAQQVVLKGLDDSYGPDERKVMGAEIDGLLNQMVELANYNDQGRYVFSGYKTDTKPFQLVSKTDPASPIFTATALASDGVTVLSKNYHVDTVVYNGDANIIQRDIAEDESMKVNINGGQAFTDSTGGGSTFDPAIKDIFAIMIRIRDYLMGEDYLKMHVSSNNIQPTPPAVEEAVPGDTTGIDPATAVPPYTANDILGRDLLSTAYASLQDTTEKITSNMTINGARLKVLETSLERADKASLEIKSLLSQNEEINVAELISEIKHQELVYQTTINISGKTGSIMSLFDVLQ
jgi:flagellin-like hook-associated protein FlgL